MRNSDLIELLSTKPAVALVGATNDKSKFGNRIFNFLLNKGYTAIPVNPRAQIVENVKAYHTLTDAVAEHSIELVIVVIPPKFSLEVIKEAELLGLKNIWLQPGASDDAVQNFLTEKSMNFSTDECVMLLG